MSNKIIKLEHIADKEISKVLVTKQLATPDYKPKGFWYTTAGNFEKYMRNESKEFPKKEVYSVEVNRTTLDNPDPTKVVVLNNSTEWDRFTVKYGVYFNTKDIPNTVLIKWKEVAQDFAGIEVIPIRKDKKLRYATFPGVSKDAIRNAFPKVDVDTMFWYTNWEYYAGCVWGKGGIIKCEWIKELPAYNGKSSFERPVLTDQFGNPVQPQCTIS